MLNKITRTIKLSIACPFKKHRSLKPTLPKTKSNFTISSAFMILFKTQFHLCYITSFIIENFRLQNGTPPQKNLLKRNPFEKWPLKLGFATGRCLRKQFQTYHPKNGGLLFMVIFIRWWWVRKKLPQQKQIQVLEFSLMFSRIGFIFFAVNHIEIPKFMEVKHVPSWLNEKLPNQDTPEMLRPRMI